MKIFRIYQKLLAFAIIRDKLINSRLATAQNVKNLAQNYSLNLQTPLPWIAFVLIFIFTVCYLYFEANTFKQYSDAFYMLVTSIGNACAFMILVWKRCKIYELIDRFEKAIETRKLILYEKISLC